MRACEICLGHELHQLHRQEFFLPGASRSGHYDVVACVRCGFVFANDIPIQKDQSRYYQDSGKHLHAVNLPAGLAAVHKDFFDFIVASHPQLAPDAAILDIGSSMGHFLTRFKSAGFYNLLGLEPSRTASDLARETYGIDVVPSTLENFRPDRHFDLITLCGVLEHLVDLNRAVSRIARLLAPGGRCFIAVPDAGSFGANEPREPFLEFAMEHINFFTEQSLDNLLGKNGFRKIACASNWNDFYANHYLLALYEHIGTGVEWLRDGTGADSIERYVASSGARLSAISAQIAALAESGVPVIVWGAGSLASRLCATTALPDCRILAFVDSNAQLHGTTMLGKSIHAPEWVREQNGATILIASYVYGQEIRDRLVEDFKWNGPIVVI